MSLFDGAHAAVGATADLRIGQALEIVQAYGVALERSRGEPGTVADIGGLPYPKDTIKWALLHLLGATPDGAGREPLKMGYVSLAEWQDRAQCEAAVFDSSRLRKKIDPLALAREFAERATPEDRCLAAARAEQAVLIAELRRKGYW